MRCFRLETTIAAPPAACFELSLSVDAHAASMSGSGEDAVAGVTSGSLVLGDTLMTDDVRFRAPFGPAGTVAEQLVLTAYLTRLLQRRNTWLTNELENTPRQ